MNMGSPGMAVPPRGIVSPKACLLDRAGAWHTEAVRCPAAAGSVSREVKTETPVQALRSLRKKTIRCYRPGVIYEWSAGKAASHLRRHGVPVLTMGSRAS